MNAPPVPEPVPSRRRVLPVVVLSAIVLLPALLVVFVRHSFMADPLPAGATVPDVTLLTMEGKPLRSGELFQQRTILLFFSTTCSHCRIVLQSLRTLSVNSAAPLPVIAVSGESAEAVRAVQEEMHLPFRLLLDPLHRARDAFRVRMLPTMFVIDSGGILQRSWTGEISVERLTALVHALPPS